MPSDKNNASIFFLGINDMQMEKGSMNAILNGNDAYPSMQMKQYIEVIFMLPFSKTK